MMIDAFLAAYKRFIARRGTEWLFKPPAAPHSGGICEAGVKSIKHHLRRIMGDTTLTYEELSTLVCQIDACLNSRPLCSISEDSNDNFMLTSSHFLKGRSMISPPNSMTRNITGSPYHTRKLIQKMEEDFWEMWSSE
ncbi:hypothetical protein JTB14_013285 [Gonioctena quinquepunctata]|nr:hypothetical protein JTB14_013285 [Gonioctena quinquepunctata]